MSEQPIETVEPGVDPVADDTDHPEYVADNEGAYEDGSPASSTYDEERGTAS